MCVVPGVIKTLIDINMDEEEISLVPFITEIGVYIIVASLVLIVASAVVVYPGIYYGRWKSRGPIFELETKDHAKIEGMILEPKDPKTCKLTILFFHSNSGNLGSNIEFLKELNEVYNAYVLCIDYRGFGNNSGFPSESGLINDAESIFDCILNDDRMKDTKKVVYGRSLGGSVAVALAEKTKEIDYLVLEDMSLTSKSMIKEKIRILNKIPGFLMDMGLVLNPWNSEDRVKELKVPVLFITGSNIGTAEKLYKLCKSKDKMLMGVDDNFHKKMLKFFSDS